MSSEVLRAVQPGLPLRLPMITLTRPFIGSRLIWIPLSSSYIRTPKHLSNSSKRMSSTNPSNAPQPEEDWKRSDVYHNSFLIPKDEALEFAQKNSQDNDLPAIAVSPAQGKLLNLLARSIGAKRILEVGTLGGCVSLT